MVFLQTSHLADLCEKNWNSSLKTLSVIPSLYLSAAAISCDAMLSMTKFELKLVLDPDMYFFFEKGMRGDVSSIPKRYSKANNKYLKHYDPKQEFTHIRYSDANNLYGYVTSKFLPTGIFKLIDLKEFDSNKYSSNSFKGCVPEVDINYSLAPDKINVAEKKMSCYQWEIAGFHNILICNIKILDEELYVLHYEHLLL